MKMTDVRKSGLAGLSRRRALALGVAGLAGAMAGLPAGPAHALGVDEAQSFVEAVVEEMRVLVDNDRSGPEGAREFLDLLERRASLSAVGKFAVGRAWREMSEGQQAAYQAAFRDYIADTYQKRFGEYAGEDILVTGATDAGKKGVLVKSNLKRPNGADLAVEWLVSDRSGQVKLSDVLFEGVSLAVTLRETFGGMIEKRNGDVDVFIADLAASNGA